MLYRRLLLSLTLGFFALLFLNACQDEETTPSTPSHAKLRLSFLHVVGNQTLTYNTTEYTNANDERYTLEEFKFYLSNVRLRNSATGALYEEPDSYHLVSPTTENGMRFMIEIPEVPTGTYDQIEFSIGIDSLRNYSLDQVGDLDPASNMVWDWNTGYKFLLLEGRYFPESGTPAGLVYHIGSDFNYKTLNFEPQELLILQEGQEGLLDFQVDIDGIFREPTPISFAQNNVVMFQPISRKVAENYAGHMISLESVTVE